MKMCPKKYEEVFQQLNQYDVFAVSTEKLNTLNKPRERTERFKNMMWENFQKYMNLFSQVQPHRLLCLFYT